MEPGQGYMLYATDSVTLTYPASEALDTASRSPVGMLLESAVSGCGVRSTPVWDVIYGSVDVNGEPAPVGTWVEILTPRGEVAGCYVVEEPGKLRMTHVYGAEGGGALFSPGFRTGEGLSFRVDGFPASIATDVAWRHAPSPQAVELNLSIQRVYLPLVMRER
jgi:hypothetical protein